MLAHGCPAPKLCSLDGLGSCVDPPPPPCATCQTRELASNLCAFSCRNITGCLDAGCPTMIDCKVTFCIDFFAL